MKRLHAVLNRRDGPKSFRVQGLFSVSLMLPQTLCSNDDVTHEIRLQGFPLYSYPLYLVLRAFHAVHEIMETRGNERLSQFDSRTQGRVS